MTLPAVRTGRGLVAAAAATVLLCAAMYFVPQRWPLTDPVLLPLTALDRAIPFWPVSGLAYFAVFPMLLATFLALPGRETATRFLYACLLAQLVGMTCFLLWPTAYPRALFPLPPGTGSLGAALARFCRSTDEPLNCLPSLHVSTVTLCVCALRDSRWLRAAVLLGVPMSLSTLTFKQHYVADVVAGLVLGLASWWLCFRWKRLRVTG